ncbi:MAG TPA: putative metal-binding motif-containing protein [bacterium]|nr:putative metal-binding motif-containing protein [bacterium]
MRTKIGLALVGVVGLAVCLGIARAQSVPQLINYQGRLTDAAGHPLNGVTVDLTFTFYGTDSEATAYLSVLQEDVMVANGIYHVLIGSGTVTPEMESSLADVFQKHQEVWMGVRVDADAEMTPRSRITSVPYALFSAFSASTDPSFLGAFIGNPDWDGDGYLKAPQGGNTVDCNDGNSSIHPGAPEICGDFIDQDCDGNISCLYAFAILPMENEVNVPLDIGQVRLGFSMPVLPADVTMVLSDEVGPVGGAWSLDGSGTLLTFIPDPLLLTMSTQYTVRVTMGLFHYEYSFYTEEPSWTVDPMAGVGKAFVLDLYHGTCVEPPGLCDLISGLGLTVPLLLGIIEADTAPQQMKFIFAEGDLGAPDPFQQDMTLPTFLLPPADLSGNPGFVVGPFDLPIYSAGLQMNITGVIISGIFERDYKYIGKAEFSGYWDMGLIAMIVGMDPADLCAFVGGCVDCPHDPGRQECMYLHITNLRADEKADPIVPIAVVTAVDLGGTATFHMVELTLTHPETGDPEPVVDLRVTVSSGNGTVNGGPETIVPTGPDGKAVVVVNDPDGGTDQLEIDIESVVPFNWVQSRITVSF